MATPSSAEFRNQVFTNARTHNAWQDKPVEDGLLQQIWDCARWAPTSMNCNPARITFVKSIEAKEKLKTCLSEGNIKKTMAAPVCTIIGVDTRFYENLPRLFPSFPGAADMFHELPELAQETAFRNASLQGAYFMIAARSFGLDCGPMSGFDAEKLEAAFFPDGRIKVNFICNLGYGDPAGLYPRGPRPAFDEACEIK